MSNLKKPEISRICPFTSGDIVQIFAENADKNTELYVWHNPKAKVNYMEVLDGKFNSKAEADEYKRSLAKSLPVDCEGVENLNNMLPEFPPEDAIVYTPDHVCENVLYFGEQPGPQPVDGKYKRVNPEISIMWLKNEAGFSKPTFANRPEIWNQSARVVSPGSKITFYGRNLGKVIGFSDGTHFSKIGIVRSVETGEYIRLEGLEETSYGSSLLTHYSEYRIPANLKPGEYEFYAYAGSAGIYGWSEAAPLTVKEGYDLNEFFRTKWNRCAGDVLPMPQCEVRSIPADNLTPFADYTDKIQGAIDELAEIGGGIVMLGAGVFPVNKTIIVKPGVVLLGSGVSTVLKANETVGLKQNWDDVIFSEKPGGKMGWANNWLGHIKKHNENTVIRLLDNCGIESLKIELGGGANMGILVANNVSDRADNVFCNNVTVDGMNLSELETDGNFGVTCSAFTVGARTTELTIWNCKFSATIPIYVLPSRHLYAKIINNDIICRPRQINESEIGGLRYSIVSNNLFKGGRRSFVSQEGLSHNWIYQNRSEDVNRAGNALEAYMSEHGLGVWEGKAAECGKDYIKVSESYADILPGRGDLSYSEARDEFHYFLFIIKGRGFGQYREVMDIVETNGECKLVLDKDFDVIPDNTTCFTLVFGTHHNMWLHNNSTLSNGHSQFSWQCSFENIVDTHAMDLSAGMRFFSHHANLKDGKKQIAVCAFNTISGCRTRSSGTGITFASTQHFVDYSDEKWQDFCFSRGIFGNCIRGCTFDGASGHVYVKNLGYTLPEPYPAGIVLDGGFNRVVENRLIGYKTPFAIINDCKGNCFARNEVSEYEEMFMGSGTPIGIDTEV